MTPRPEVSVIVPFRNAAADLPHALIQLARLEGPVEILLIDDASTDTGPELAEAYSRKDPRMRVIRRPQAGGATRSRMTGVEAARGDYIWFCDVDDEWEPDIVTALLHEATMHNADLVACRAERVEADGRRWIMEGSPQARSVSGRELPSLVWTGQLRGYLWNKLIRRTLIPPLRREPLTSQDDFLMILDILEHTHRVRLIPDIKYRYLEKADSISTGASLRRENVERCRDEAMKRLLPAPPTRRERRDADAFTLWFYLVPAIATPVHRGWANEDADAVRRELTSQISWRTILHLARQQPSVAVHAALIRASGRCYPKLYRLSRRVTRGLHAGNLRNVEKK
ncbi:MAG: glycosyltransferase family 2 protein [Micrococcaceae bacterium]